MWPFKNLESGRALRITAIAYLAASLALLSFTTILYFSIDISIPTSSSAFYAAVLSHAPLFLGSALLIGLGLVVLLTWKCNHCRSGPVRRISTALDKMSKGDLGWKITLRRGDELADVADSVTQASQLLANRINKLQSQTRQLTEIENYLIDSMEADRITNPYTLKALRKLKICTHRLSSDMDDFQISAIASMPPNGLPQQDKPVEELEKV
jgi:methyl-accepting chemotaxis protein